MRENENLIAQNIIEQEKEMRTKKREYKKQLDKMRALLANTKKLEKKTKA